jgi:hypothetical protein
LEIKALLTLHGTPGLIFDGAVQEKFALGFIV